VVSMNPITVTVSRSLDAEGRRAHTTRGMLFDAALGERILVRRSTQPFLDAARVLAGEGVDSATPLVMHHAGQDYDALRSTVGAAAKLRVRDSGGSKPVFENWSPSPFAGGLRPPVTAVEKPFEAPAIHASQA
jgi:hypothetical protein